MVAESLQIRKLTATNVLEAEKLMETVTLTANTLEVRVILQQFPHNQEV